MLAAARARIHRLSPESAWALASAGEALVVDIRSADDRRRDGIVPGSLHVPRTVLEWRADPSSDWHNPELRPGRRLVLLCGHGYSSSLAAAVLVDLGHLGAGDVVGGHEAWRRDGMPVVAAPEPRSDVLPGMGAPEP
jgi:rhodanese-related sulfurtransferase